MTHTYNVSGMTCGGCQAKVQNLLSKVKGVKNVMIDLGKGQVSIDMDKHISTSELAGALKDFIRNIRSVTQIIIIMIQVLIPWMRKQNHGSGLTNRYC
jgi:copper chaperone CopZ